MREMKTVTLNGKKYDSFADAKVREAVGDLNGLETTAKSNLVKAINEIKSDTAELDTTLSVPGKAADSKAVGDALKDKLDSTKAITEGWVTAQIQAAINATWEASY